MSTSQTDGEKGARTYQRDESPSIQHVQQTQTQTPPPPLPYPPQPPKRSGGIASRGWLIGLVVVLVLLLTVGTVVLAQIASQGQKVQVTPTPVPSATQSGSPQATTTPGGNDSTPVPAQGVVLGPQACPASVSDPAYWNAIIRTNNGERSVEGVSCANIMNTPSLQALVNVRHTNGTLDVYVFDKISASQPTRIFLLQGLVKGNARISGYNTVMTAEVDTHSALNTGKSVATMTPDLFREFDWSSAEGTLVQTAFPGIYPDLTRYQAEADQALVNKGQGQWKNDPKQVAQALAKQFFGWQRSITATVLSGGSSHDVNARVRVQESPLQGAQSQGPYAVISLSRLEGNTHNFWVAIAVENSSMLTLDNIDARSLISSPLTLEGTGAAFEAVIGKAVVYDHLYTDIGHAQVLGDKGMGIAHYSTNITYSSSFQQGVQEGVVAVYEANGGISDENYTAVVRKVLLNPAPGVALGVLPCPDAVKDPAHWTPFLSIPATPIVAEQVSCGNLLGKPTLQAMVVAREVIGGGPTFRSVFVFDNITASRPNMLFKITHLSQGEAAISGYSTIMTGEVDLNSPLNSGATKTVDLFREWKWEPGSSTFVSVAFPGIYPDLTRYQAERDQQTVSNGQDQWKYDAAQVAKNLAVTLLKWSTNSQTTVVSGGGSQSVDAVVQVSSTGPDHPFISVTLSRLEGNVHNIWCAVAVADGSSMSITSPVKWTTISSPVTVKGTGSAFEGDVGTVYVLDHLYNDIGHAKGVAATGMGETTFTATIPYSSTFRGGIQEGVLAFYSYSAADGAIAGCVMQKVLIKA